MLSSLLKDAPLDGQSRTPVKDESRRDGGASVSSKAMSHGGFAAAAAVDSSQRGHRTGRFADPGPSSGPSSTAFASRFGMKTHLESTSKDLPGSFGQAIFEMSPVGSGDSKAFGGGGESRAFEKPSTLRLPSDGGCLGADKYLTHRGGRSAGQAAASTVPKGAGGAEVDGLGSRVGGAGPGTQPEKPKLSKAERREKQEAERAAKALSKAGGSGGAGGRGEGASASGGVGRKTSGAAAEEKAKASAGGRGGGVGKRDGGGEKKTGGGEKKGGTPTGAEKKPTAPAARIQFDDKQKVTKVIRKSLLEQTETKNRVELFRHLPQFVHSAILASAEDRFLSSERLHPAVYELGMKYLTGEVVGGNARCVAMLRAFQLMIKDFSAPPEKSILRELTAKIHTHVSFLATCRPMSISMGNAITWLKNHVSKINEGVRESDLKEKLREDISSFVHEKIVLAGKVITEHALGKIREGDVVLTFGCSHLVETILMEAHRIGKAFHVVVVDSRPKFEGQVLLRRLLSSGIKCTYTHIGALMPVMKSVDKVFLGAASVLANGTVYARVGCATTAMVAQANSVPVLVCCESYKLHERVQLDSICSNELGDPELLVKVAGRSGISELEGWADQHERLQLLNLNYDLMPADYVTMIITELGMIPATSVPVILREYRKEPVL